VVDVFGTTPVKGPLTIVGIRLSEPSSSSSAVTMSRLWRLAAHAPPPAQPLSQTTVCDRPEGTVSTEPVSARHPTPETTIYSSPHNTRAAMSCDRVRGRERQNRVRTGLHRRPRPPTAARRPERRDCLKVYTDTATGTKADRPQWNACLADLRRGDTLLIWKIDRLGRNLRDLIDIVTTLQTRGVGVRSLTNGSTLTQELLGWTPTGPTLIQDLDTGAYSAQ